MSGVPKHYEYVTMDFEVFDRMDRGESFTAFAWALRLKWSPGNEAFWDDYDAESLVDSELKRQFTENVRLYARLRLYRELRARGMQTDGLDPLLMAWRVPDLFDGLKARFPVLVDPHRPRGPASPRDDPAACASC